MSTETKIGILGGAIFAVSFAAMTSCLHWYAESQLHHLYPQSAVVSNLDFENDTVIVRNPNGHEFGFRGIEDYEIGDKVAMIMDTNGTSLVYDDKIVDVRYAGV